MINEKLIADESIIHMVQYVDPQDPQNEDTECTVSFRVIDPGCTWVDDRTGKQNRVPAVTIVEVTSADNRMDISRINEVLEDFWSDVVEGKARCEWYGLGRIEIDLEWRE